ncbi:MAG: metal-dependent hydrolase [Planctomycetes bacterium]|nr:metal-dependent hydrolase [Planctomycetota bacterium]
MKGITHFMSGIAVASCFPSAVRSAVDANTFLLPLGGVFGIMPDTLDFRFARYFWKHEHVVRLTEEDLDPAAAAQGVAAAIDQAFKEKRPVTLRLDTVRVSVNYYRTYNIFIDSDAREVTAVIGPLKTMGQIFSRFDYAPSEASRRKEIEEHGLVPTLVRIISTAPCLPGTLPPETRVATARFQAEVRNTYYQETEVGVFHGPDFEFVPEGDRVRIDFIPWHRRWTHAFTTGLVMAPVGFAVCAGWGALARSDWRAFANPLACTAAIIATLAFWTHVIEDQIGYLGSNLFPPFTKKRSQGLKWVTSASPMPNVITNYLAILTVLWNLNAFAAQPVFHMPWASGMAGDFTTPAYYVVSLLNYLTYVFAIPVALLFALSRLYRKYYLRSIRPVIDDEFDEAEMAAEMRDV